MKIVKIAVFVCLIGLFTACKDKNNEQNSETGTVETTEMTPDTVTSDTLQPVDNPEPGVEKSGSQEQIP